MVSNKLFISNRSFYLSNRSDSVTDATGKSIPTTEEMKVLMSKSADDASPEEIVQFYNYQVELMPAFNRAWKKCLHKVKSNNKLPRPEVVARCVLPSDHALLMQTLTYHREKWIEDIMMGKVRAKGQSKGSKKLASDRKGYKKAGELAVQWMKSDNWSTWMTKCMQLHAPSLNVDESMEEENEGEVESSEEDEEIVAWGWKVESQEQV